MKNINFDLKCYELDQIKREDTKMNPEKCENKNTQNQKESNKDINTLIKPTTSKSLNVNKQGLLNISEKYISSSDSNSDHSSDSNSDRSRSRLGNARI